LLQRRHPPPRTNCRQHRRVRHTRRHRSAIAGGSVRPGHRAGGLYDGRDGHLECDAGRMRAANLRSDRKSPASAGQAGLLETPAFDLTRHFLREFFYLRFLTDTGADSVKRATIGSVSGLLALSILFPQFVVGRYAKMRTVEEYRQALLSDQLFTI